MDRHDIVTRYAVISAKNSTKIVSNYGGKDWLHFGVGWEIQQARDVCQPIRAAGAVHSSSLVFLFVKLILTTETRSIQINTMDGDAEYRERDRLWRQKKRESDPTARQKDRDYSQSYYEKNHEIINKKSSEYRKKQRTEHPEEVRARDREKRKRYVAMHQEEVMVLNSYYYLTVSSDTVVCRGVLTLCSLEGCVDIFVAVRTPPIIG